MIKAVVIDDERNAVGIIIEFCKKISYVEIIASFTDPLEALIYVEQNPDVDLLFLDIQMSRLNGLSLAKKIENIKIILTSAYPNYAIQGYELDVVDYLLKPFSFERFERATQKAKEIIGKGQAAIREQIKTETSSDENFVFIKSDLKNKKVYLKEIIYIEGSGNYVTIHTVNSKIMTLQNLIYFEMQLKQFQFIRIHKSYIVSVKYIQNIETRNILIDNVNLPIGESYKNNVTNYMRKNRTQF